MMYKYNVEGFEKMPVRRMTKKKDHNRKTKKIELKGDRLRHKSLKAKVIS